MRHWGFFDCLAYGSIWVGAILLFLDGGLKMATDLKKRHPVIRKVLSSGYWMFAPIAFLGVSAITLIGAEMGWWGILPAEAEPSGYYWVDLNIKADWPGEDADCSPGLTPDAALCNDDNANTIAQCWNGGGLAPTSGPAAEKCNRIKKEAN